ncbi:HTH_Tnp_Tc3_2 domain-containing protein [Trichonephila clavipes]|nr:HTH_Tnp_Tc3_2 domain-containing protein [Trichonephila clavipes]
MNTWQKVSQEEIRYLNHFLQRHMQACIATGGVRHHLSEELRWRAIGRLEERQSQIEVARWLNVSPFVIHRLWHQFLTTDSVYRRFSQGRSRASISADDRCLSLCARRNRTAIPAELKFSFIASSRKLVSRSIVSRRLCEHDL